MASMFGMSTEFAAELYESSETESEPTKDVSAKDGGNNCQPARAHASLKTRAKVCPACTGQHSFSNKGDLLYRNRLSSCPDFNNLGPVKRAHLIQSAKGCQLRLD